MTGDRLNALRFVAFLALIALTACETKPFVTQPYAADVFFDNNFTCTLAQSTRVKFADFVQHQATYKDQCVHVEGFSNGTLIGDNAGVFGHAGPEALVGLYWQTEDMRQRLWHGPSFIDIVARLRTCDDVGKYAAEHADEANAKPQPSGNIQTVAIGVASGICHFGKGNALYVSQYKIIPTAMD